MNLFNEAIYGKYLEHTAPGTKWGKHKYLYITETGRYVYPEDISKGKSAQQFRSQQINDQIKSAHSNATSSKMELTPSSELKKRAEARAAAKVSGTAAGSKSVATNSASRNTITIKPTNSSTSKTEDKKTDTDTTKDGSKYKNMSEEMKQMLLKDEEKKSGKKSSGGSGKKKSGGSSKKGSSKASTKTKESEKMGLTDDDLKNMEVNTQATNRDEVLKNIALRVIRGDYGNGADRKAKLGNYYDEVQKRVNELMKSGSIQREGPTSQKTEEKKEQSTSNVSSSKSTSNQKYTTTKGRTDKPLPSKHSNMEEYKDGDKDFDEKHYKDANRIGNTDFFTYKRDDGKYVILEEDMKWVVDDKPSSKLAKNLENMNKYSKNVKGQTTKGWQRLATQAINGVDFETRLKRQKEAKHSDILRDGGNFLEHIGKKHRSGRYKFGTGDRPYQHEGRTARNHSWKDRRTMSDEDLNKAINRAKREYELYKNERDNRSATQKFVEDVITGIGKDVIKMAGRGAIQYAGRQFVSKSLENPELANAMFGGGGGGKKKKKK